MAVEPRKLLTYEDFLSFPDDGIRREVIGGEGVVVPSPDVRHQRVVVRLGNILFNHLTEHGGGEVFVAPLDVRLSDHDIVEPDLIFVADDRLDIIKENYLLGAPSLLVEVVSNPRTDRVLKRDRYARAGVPEYWIVDPRKNRVEVLRLDGETYAEPVILEPGDALTTDQLPGLAIDVTALLAD